MKIGVLGSNGRLGSNLLKYFKQTNNESSGFDINGESDSLETVLSSDIIFLCLPTPYVEGQEEYDTTALEENLKTIPDGKIVVIKSTVTPGTTDRFQNRHQNLKLIFCPEFLTEKTAWEDTIKPDVNIIGTTKISYRDAKTVLDLLPEAPKEFIMPAKSAEMVKIARNNYFVNKIVFMNILYDLCKASGVKWGPVVDALSSDRRIRKSHMEVEHQGGRGGGGTCFPKDQAAFQDWSKKIDQRAYEFIKHYGDINRSLLEETGKSKGHQYYEK
jgi:nucleotide sugar dehydrogenase